MSNFPVPPSLNRGIPSCQPWITLVKGKLIPAEITVYADRSFTFVTKTPPTSSLILEATKLKKGSSEPHKDKVGAIPISKIKEIAEIKFPESNAVELESVIKMVKGTARSMGINVEK